MRSFILLILLFLFLSGVVGATVLVEDDFEEWSEISIYEGGPDPPSPWENWSLTGAVLPETCNSVARPMVGGIGINTTGGVSNSQGLIMPRCESVLNSDYGGFYGTLRLPLSGYSLSNMYLRWYLKFDDGFDKDISSGFKMIDRIIAVNSDEYYIQMHGTTLSTSYLAIYGPGYLSSWRQLASNSDVYSDHQYHCVEIQILLNSSSSGRVRCWIDGSLTADFNNIQTSSSSTTFDYMNFSLGNASDGLWQSTWLNMYFDNFAIGDDYIGLASGESSSTTNGTVSGHVTLH